MARPAVHDWGESPPARTSPLFCRYHGFLIGYGLALACDDRAGEGAAARRGPLWASLRELGIDDASPAPRDPLAAPSYAGRLAAILPRLAQASQELAEFAILGGLLARQARAITPPPPAPRRVASDAAVDDAAAVAAEIERLRARYDLPPIDPRRHAAPIAADPDAGFSPGLIYLAEIVARLDAERDTALLLLPAAPAADEDHEGFHRPAVEQGGYRALRAWTAFEGTAGADLLLALIGRCGLCWADASDAAPGILTAIGAARALRTPVIAVARADAAAAVPAYVGGVAVLRYDPRAADWPAGPALLLAACLAGVTLAAERGDRLSLRPGPIEDAFDGVSRALGRVLLPPEGREAQRRGRRAIDAGDLVLAEACFDEACRLGLDDDETHLWRGWARLGLGRLTAARGDLDAVLGLAPAAGGPGAATAVGPAAGPPGEWRPIAAYLRAVLREAQGDLPGALHDVDLAVSLGLTDAEVRDRRDALAARVSAAAAGPSAWPA